MYPSRRGRTNAAVLSSAGEARRPINVIIPKSLEDLVRAKLEERHHSTEDEVVADALRLMQARDEIAHLKRVRLKNAIDRGYEDVAAGRIISLDGDNQLDAFFGEL